MMMAVWFKMWRSAKEICQLVGKDDDCEKDDEHDDMVSFE